MVLMKVGAAVETVDTAYQDIRFCCLDLIILLFFEASCSDTLQASMALGKSYGVILMDECNYIPHKIL